MAFMRLLLKRIFGLRAFLAYLFKVDPVDGAVAQYLRRFRKSDRGDQALVLVQCVEDPFYFALFGRIVLSLRESHPVRVEHYVYRSLAVGESNGVGWFLFNRMLVNFINVRKWSTLYASFCDGVGFGPARLSSAFPAMLDAVRAFRLWRSLKTRDDLQAMTIDAIPVGDLISDSYLRFKPAASLALDDFYLCIVIWQACRNVRVSRNYFRKKSPALFLSSYSTYVQHGVPVRVALALGIPVFAFGNYQEFAKQLSVSDWIHTRDARQYAADFSALGERDARLARADAALASRMAGGIDSATAYMKVSAYADTGEQVPDVRGAIVVFLHDFFDSPHIYHDLVFPDFWDWICFTIETLTAAGIPFYLKAHPNQIDLSQGILTQLMTRYPAVRMLSPRITNRQLAQAGIACAVTVYGTVAHEMAYLGVPSIAAARNPHVAFDFCLTAKDRGQYKDALLGYRERPWDAPSMRAQSCAFYYMHNLHLSPEDAALLDFLQVLRRHCRDHESEQLTDGLETLAAMPRWRAQIDAWGRLL